MHAMQFRPHPHPKSGTCAQPTGLLEVTMTARRMPFVLALTGMWVARPERTMSLPPGGDGSQPDGERKAHLRLPGFVGKLPKAARQRKA